MFIKGRSLKYLFFKRRELISFLEFTNFLQSQSDLKSRIDSKQLANELFINLKENKDSDFISVIKILNGNLLDLGEHLNLKKSIRFAASQEMSLSIERINKLVDSDHDSKTEIVNSSKSSELSIEEILIAAEEILINTGKNSQIERFEILKDQFSKCKNYKELKWLIRILEVH